MAATILIYGFIVLGTASGFASGFNEQVKRLGSGVKSMLITAVVVVIFGASIMNSDVVKPVFSDIKESLGESFLAQDGIFRLFSYVVLFFFVLLLLKVCTATLSSFTSTQNGETDWLNKGLGAALACTMCVLFVMLVLWIMTLVPSGKDSILHVKQSAAGIFYSNNLFLALFGTFN